MNKKYPMWNKDRVVYLWEDDCLRIGSDDDDVTEIRGNSKIWKEIIEMLNGQNDLLWICSQLKDKYGVEERETISFIEQFSQKNFLEWLDSPNVMDDWNQYFESVYTYYSSRGFGGKDFLKKLNALRITILGCGAGGSNIAFQLSQLGVGALHLVDPDIVDKSNVNRQALFTMSDVGQKKVVVLQNSLKEKNPFIKITASDQRMSRVCDVISEIKYSDWVICAMDEPPYVAQRLVNKACMELNIPSLYCFSQKSAGKMFFVNPHSSGCVDCFLQEHDSPNFQKLVHTFISYEDELITANIFSNISLLCAWVVKKWFDCFTGTLTDPWNKLYRLDFDSLSEEVFDRFEKQAECPTCGGGNLDGTHKNLWDILHIS